MEITSDREAKMSEPQAPTFVAGEDDGYIDEGAPLMPDSKKGSQTKTEPTFWQYVKLAFCLIGWYAFNILYNIDNKASLNMVALPMTISATQLAIGWLFFIPAWMTQYKKAPRFHSWGCFMATMLPMGICHLMVHLFAVISLGLGAVSFTHIVKAGEPVLTSVFAAVFLAKISSVWTYLTLIPIIGGVALASAKELSFTWMSFICAMLSNVGSAGRSILAKSVMNNPEKVATRLDTYNQYAITTIVATIPGVILAYWYEGDMINPVFLSATENGNYTGNQIFLSISRSALWYYFYNVLAFLSLEKLDQVTHAIANTLKRVVVIVSAVVFFGTPVHMLGAAGSCIAIIGTFLYSISKAKYG